MVLLTMMLSLTVKGYCRANKADKEAATSGKAVNRPPTGLLTGHNHPFCHRTEKKQSRHRQAPETW
jgi:hypothetical protein